MVAVFFDRTNVTANAIFDIRILFSVIPSLFLVLEIVLMVLFSLTDDKITKHAVGD